jgi:hypothetical protein
LKASRESCRGGIKGKAAEEALRGSYRGGSDLDLNPTFGHGIRTSTESRGLTRGYRLLFAMRLGPPELKEEFRITNYLKT